MDSFSCWFWACKLMKFYLVDRNQDVKVCELWWKDPGFNIKGITDNSGDGCIQVRWVGQLKAEAVVPALSVNGQVSKHTETLLKGACDIVGQCTGSRGDGGRHNPWIRGGANLMDCITIFVPHVQSRFGVHRGHLIGCEWLLASNDKLGWHCWCWCCLWCCCCCCRFINVN